MRWSARPLDTIRSPRSKIASRSSEPLALGRGPFPVHETGLRATLALSESHRIPEPKEPLPPGVWRDRPKETRFPASPSNGWALRGKLALGIGEGRRHINPNIEQIVRNGGDCSPRTANRASEWSVVTPPNWAGLAYKPLF